MIQRKQSVFLLLSVISLAGLAFLPLASFFGDQDSLVMYVFQIVSKVPDSIPDFGALFLMPLLAIVVITAILSFAAIFMFKNRARQLMVVRLLIFLLVVAIGLFFLYYVNALETASGGLIATELGIYLIPVALIFLFLAMRGIIADEKLVRSSDRLR
ncbi:MAG: DUF4293 domain-containing protein [Bacteroidales bacterium]|jgi:hypothetical protein|nr:DUF4293 domain-containing protein [Bacteroidales bacterium]